LKSLTTAYGYKTSKREEDMTFWYWIGNLISTNLREGECWSGIAKAAKKEKKK